MKKYNYEARDRASNKVVTSVVQAESEKSAAKLLMDQGFTPLHITEVVEGGLLGRLTGRISAKDRIVFSRQLATLIGAGLPLSQSLHTVLEQTDNKPMQAVVEEITTDVEGGQSLTVAFGKHPKVFNNIFLALVEAGEASGTLDEALQRLAAQQEKDAAMMSKIKGAMIYPAIVLVVIIAVLVFMLVTVVPQVSSLYSSMNQTLPPLTQGLVAVSNFVAHYWYIVVIAIVVIAYFVMQYFKTDNGIKMKDTFKLNMPMFKGMFRKLYMARFTRTGQTLLSTGVAMLDMLRISADSVNNTIISASISRAAEKVKGGKALSVALKPEEYVLILVPQMIRIGEQSGKIDDMMGKTAQVYEDELDQEIRAISTAIEPILMVVMAVVAGGMVGAVLFPIYTLVGSIGT